jgi:phage-related minor tail protein
MKTGWQLALQDLANQQINFKEVFTSAFSSIEGSLVNLVSGTESAKEKFKKFCEDVTKTILQSMAQIIIRGLITKAIMGAIGLAGGGGGAIGTTASDFSGHSTLLNFNGFMAKGGSVKSGGTYLVGENGPELLQMGSQSGRVFNNRQTQTAFNSSPQNVRIELKNESGTELKAEEASVNFDPDTMIISAVIKGVSNNTMGIRNMLKGVAAT